MTLIQYSSEQRCSLDLEIFLKSIWTDFDIPNSLLKLRQQRHCFTKSISSLVQVVLTLLKSSPYPVGGGGRFGKHSTWATVFSMFWAIFFANSRKNNGQGFWLVLRLNSSRLYDCCNHCPSSRPVHVAGSWPRAPIQVWKSDVHVKSWNPVSTRSPLTKLWRKRMREQYKGACVSPLTGSVLHKMVIAKSFSTLQAINQCCQTHCDSP